MKKTQAQAILEQWEALESPQAKCLRWSTFLDEALEIGNEYIDWKTDVTYVKFDDDSILGWDCFFIRLGTEEEIGGLT